jgi:hypothetical protein
MPVLKNSKNEIGWVSMVMNRNQRIDQGTLFSSVVITKSKNHPTTLVQSSNPCWAVLRFSKLN